MPVTKLSLADKLAKLHACSEDLCLHRHQAHRPTSMG